MWVEPICVRTVPSRAEGDCAILALAILTGWAYEDILSMAGRISAFPHKTGLYTPQIVKLAKVFGLPLRRKKTVDWDEDTGIVELWCNANRVENGPHVVVLRLGVIFDAEQVWEPEAFIRHYQADVKGILVPKEGTRAVSKQQTPKPDRSGA